EPPPRPPFAPDPLEFEEADPLLAPRRARRRPDPLPDIDPPGIDEEPPPREPAPQGDGTVVVEGHLVDDPPDDVPHPAEDVAEPAGKRQEVPPPREDSERTENRG